MDIIPPKNFSDDSFHDSEKPAPFELEEMEHPLKVVIIEDELPAFKRLSSLLQQVTRDNTEILVHLDSIAAAVPWLQNNEAPHVIFMDIHLADGSAFDLLKAVSVECPIIFTTAYDQYALEAFKTDGLDYLLKPIKKEDLMLSLQKRNRFAQIFKQKNIIIESSAKEGQTYKKRFIVRFGEHIKTLDVEEIAYCFSSHKATCACTFSGQVYPIDHNLDTLEQMLNPMDYFRINRQFITNIRAIKEMKTYSKGRVFLMLQPPTEESLIVSSEKSAKFKKWLGGEL
jgi:two-component system LytT family response regulator